MKVALFIPCFIDAFYPEVGIATLELLERFGIEVDYPQEQTCCGQPMANSGAHAEAAGTDDVSDDADDPVNAVIWRVRAPQRCSPSAGGRRPAPA